MTVRTTHKDSIRSSDAREGATTYWLIVERDGLRMNVYTVPDEERLPVFGHEEEAGTFLRVRGLGGRWRARETSAGELVSLLFGPCADVSRITLDPAVGTGARLLWDLVSMERRTFVDFLLRSSRTGAGKVGAGR
jgi:hypothetical protein